MKLYLCCFAVVKAYKQIKVDFFKALALYYDHAELKAIWALVVEFILKSDAKELIKHPGHLVSDEEYLSLQNCVERLISYEPIQYIIGKAWFCDSVFEVNPNVLIPRPETEQLVHLISSVISEKKVRILDIGSGSGCIGISLKKIHPQSEVVAVDISPQAVEMTTLNSKSILGKNRIRAVKADVLSADFHTLFKTGFDIIVSNPPYITNSETLPDNVVKYEPANALFCGDNPLTFYEAIAQHSKHLLRDGGLLFFETHEWYGQDVADYLQNQGFRDITVEKDFQNKNRIIKAKFRK